VCRVLGFFLTHTFTHAFNHRICSIESVDVSENGPFFATTFSRPFKDQSGAWRNGTSFGLNDLEALITVAHEAKEWIAAHVLKR
jgi:hypothetical protein